MSSLLFNLSIEIFLFILVTTFLFLNIVSENFLISFFRLSHFSYHGFYTFYYISLGTWVFYIVLLSLILRLIPLLVGSVTLPSSSWFPHMVCNLLL